MTKETNHNEKAVKALTAGVGTSSNLGAVVITPELSSNLNTNTNTTLILETCTMASTDEKDVDCVSAVTYDGPGSEDQQKERGCKRIGRSTRGRKKDRETL